MRIIKDFFIIISISIVLFSVVIFLGRIFKKPEFFSNLYAFGFISILIIYFIIIFFRITLKKPKYKNTITLYDWLDELNDFDENLLRQLKDITVSYGSINNLITFKEILKKQTKNDKSIMKLYRAFYKQKLKETGEELYLRTIMIAIFPAVIMMIGSDFFKADKSIVVLYFLLGAVFLAVVSMRLSINKKRNGIIIEMIDLCIEDIIEKEDQSKEQESKKSTKRRLRNSRSKNFSRKRERNFE